MTMARGQVTLDFDYDDRKTIGDVLSWLLFALVEEPQQGTEIRAVRATNRDE